MLKFHFDDESRKIKNGITFTIYGKKNVKKRKGDVGVFLKLLTGSIIGFINGFFGGGGGMICVPLLCKVIGLEEKKSHATTLLIMLPLSIASLVVYIFHKSLLYMESLKIGIGFVVGGVIGALLLKKMSNAWLCIIFSLVIIFGGVKLLL